MHPDDTLPCFRAHLGLWAIELTWMRHAVQAGLWPVHAPELMAAEMTRQQGKLYAQSENGVAVIRIEGQITKGRQQGKLYAQSENGVAVIRIEAQITKGMSKPAGTPTL